MSEKRAPAPSHECLRCGHEWAADEHDPRTCPKCGPLFKDRPSIRPVRWSPEVVPRSGPQIWPTRYVRS